MRELRTIFAALLVVAALAACGDGEPALEDQDLDGDGFTPNQGDCADDNRAINPDAPDPCDGVDNNCDEIIDELFDNDGDGFTSCAGDCRDNDNTSFPGGTEVIDGFDNDCDGIADNHTDQFDDDGDGYSEDQGDCNDNEEGDGALIGPDAIEVQLTEDGMPEGIDNDCDGLVDEALVPCPTDLDPIEPLAHAAAIDVCHEILEASYGTGITSDARSRGIFSTFGSTYVPNMGESMSVLSSGIAGDVAFTGIAIPDTPLNTTASHPDPQGPNGCSDADPATVNDYTELRLVLQVPANALSFSFDFNFMSIEFPEFVCTIFDDTFVAYLESGAFTGNVSFDSMGSRMSINSGFFDVCSTSLDPSCTGDAALIGTGYEGLEGGGTGWLTTTAPLVPGEKIFLTFAIFDEGDSILDSTVLIDNFRWEIKDVEGPVTVDRATNWRPSQFVTAKPGDIAILD